jgi:hypothetical protein
MTMGMSIVQRSIDFVQRIYHPMRSKEDFAACLDSLPEPSWFRLRMMLGSLRYTPQLIRFGLKRLALAAEEDLPPVPVGRPGLEAISKAQIVAHVGKMHVRGYTLEQAKENARIKFGVSISTVQRVWDDRGNLGAVDFRSVLKFIEEDAKDHSECLEWMDRQP